MRQIISTALVAVVVGAVAGATMGAVAQSGPEAPAQQAIVPSVTSINAHKVDGRHAVSASASRAKRAGKLVATNRQGYLPANIIKPAWRLIQGMPVGFADGVDDVGVSGLKVTRVALAAVAVPADGLTGATVSCPAGTVVIGGGADSAGVVIGDSYPNSNAWVIRAEDVDNTAGHFIPFAVCLSVDPASAITVAKKR